MTEGQPRLRMFAGPNGSGKSTLKELLPPYWLGTYVNPDELERQIVTLGHCDFSQFDIESRQENLFAHLRNSTLLRKASLTSDVEQLSFNENRLYFEDLSVNSYHASVLADYIRSELLTVGRSLSFETVMSSPSKLELLRAAKRRGYRIYLYYIATESPTINVSRVRNRVAEGGHDVPEDKIRSRYYRSLALLKECTGLTDRAFLFDNSGRRNEQVLIAEVNDGNQFEIHAEPTPKWFDKYASQK